MLWALLSYPKAPVGTAPGDQLRYSFAGRLGHAIEPAIAPLGFDWRIGVGILGAVLLSGVWHTPSYQWFGIHFEYRNLVRDLLIVSIALLSIASTDRKVRHDNGFTWGAMTEVAFLFFGIFVTIIPVLMILKAGAAGAMAPLVSRITVMSPRFSSSSSVKQGFMWMLLPGPAWAAWSAASSTATP